MSEIRPIDAIAFEKKIQQHDLWNKEGVIELIRSMPTQEITNAIRQRSKWKTKKYTTSNGEVRTFCYCEGCGSKRHSRFANFCWYCGCKIGDGELGK